MKKDIIVFKKIKIKDLIKKYNNQDVFVAVPAEKESFDLFKKIENNLFSVILRNKRILKIHRTFMKVLCIAVENGALDRLIKNKTIKQEIMEKLIFIFKNEEEVFRYILKWLFLPLEEKILPNGQKYLNVSSMAFDELPEYQAQVFFNKCYDFISDLFNITREELFGWLKNNKEAGINESYFIY